MAQALINYLPLSLWNLIVNFTLIAKGSLSSSPSRNKYDHDAFLCFCGKDTRHDFAGNLNEALKRKGISTFFDDDRLRRGKEIEASLSYHIQKSRIAIVILSKNFASSLSCLKELVQICELGMKILPVFYCVEPREVKNPKGKFGEELAKYEQGALKDEVKKWRSALHQIAGLLGHHFKKGVKYEHQYIEEIIEDASKMLNEPSEAQLQHVIGPKFNDEVNMLKIHEIRGKDEAFLDRLANVPGESSRAPGCVEKQNMQVSNLPSSSGQVRRELRLVTSSTMLSTTVDASQRNQTELTHDEVAEMEAFYAYLRDKSASSALSEEAKEALKIVLGFINNDDSILLPPEQYSDVTRSIEYLFSLPVDDGMSTKLRTLLSEALKMMHLGEDYIAVSKKCDSTASELRRVDELKISLQRNVKEFQEAKASYDEVCDKLSNMTEMKKELEEKLNVIKGDISATQSERNINLKRKRDIYVEGKTLITQIDEMREKEPRLLQEHSSAREVRYKIKSEWSQTRENCKAMM